MPYIREGKCVYHKNSDGSKGKKKGCSESEEMAKAYMKKLYMEESKSLAEFSMTITKASIPNKADRTMRIRMVSSDTGEDVFEERMSQELFDDFVTRIDDNTPVPEPFDVICEDGWEGGMPYLSVSHYKSGGGKNVPGMPEKIYVDGEMLKSSAILNDSPLGRAVWKSICQDIEERSKPLEERSYKNPVRVSIGFLDLEHKHELDGEEYVFTRSELKQTCPKCEEGIKGKVYSKGQLVHLAFTRAPANPRTSVEVYKMGDEIETRQEDAESIIGELADELVGKSVIEDDALVVKADDKKSRDEEEDDEEETSKKKKEVSKSEVTMDEETQVLEEVQPEEVVEEVQEEVVAAPAAEKSKIDIATENFKAKMLEVKSQGLTGDAALEVLQPFFNEIGEVAKQEVASPLDGVAEVVRSVVAETVQGMKAEIVAEILKALPQTQEAKAQEVPAPRSLIVNRTIGSDANKEMSQIERLARKSIGLG